MRRPFGVPLLLVFGGIAWAGVHVVAHRAVEPAGAQDAHAHHHGAAHTGYLPTSLSLCLSLALILAATSSVYPRWRGVTGRTLWLFGAVPVLGLFAGAVVDSGRSLASLETNVAGLMPVAALVLVLQIGVVIAAVRAARGFLDLVAGAASLFVGERTDSPSSIHRRPLPRDHERVPAARPALDGSPRGPPAFVPAT